MVNALRIPKSRLYKSSERANILFAVLLISVLSTGLVLHHRFSSKHYVYKTKIIQWANNKKQALTLASKAFDKLKSIASDDACMVWERKKHCYFENVSNTSKTAIEYRLSSNIKHLPKGGYNIEGLWVSKLPFACCFDRQDLRKPLSEVMTGNNPLKAVISNDHWSLAGLRWKWLKCNESLSPHIFPPLIDRAEISGDGVDKEFQMYFFDPYIAKIKTGKIYISKGCRNLGDKESYDLARSECYQEIDYCTHCKLAKISLKNVKILGYIKIKYGHNYTLGVQKQGILDFKITGTREGGYDFGNQQVAQQTPKPRKAKGSAWGRCGKEEEHKVTSSNNIFEPFSTKTWIDKLDACFFEYTKNEPYSKVGNFKSNYKNIPELRKYFWNEVIENPETEVFYFNGPSDYIEERLLAYGVSKEQAGPIVNEIVKHQPYPSATAFLEKIALHSGMKDRLHHFEFLSHRPEKFKIKAWYGEYVCEMIVQREAVNDNERAWKVISVTFKKAEKHSKGI